MDRYIVEVVVLGSESIKENIDKAEKPERIQLQCIMGNVENIHTYSQVDLFIVESDIAPQYIEEIWKVKTEYAQVIYVVSEDKVLSTDKQFFNIFYDVWIQNSPIMMYRIEILIKKLLAELDAELGVKQLDVLIDSIPDLVWYKDVRGAHIKVNDTFCKTVNKTKEQIKDRGHCYIWDLDMAEYEQGEYVCMETEEVVIEEQKTFLFHEKVKIGNEMRQLNTYKSAILGRRGETVGTVGIAHDVTDIWNSHVEFKTLINNLPFPMMLVNEKYEFLSGNNEFEALFNYSTEDHEDFDIIAFGKTYFGEDISSPEELKITRSVVMQKDAMTFHYILDKSPVYDVFQKLTGYFYIFRDTTMRYEYEERLRQLSEIDELSQLNNRKAITRFMSEGVVEVIEKKESLAIFMLDLDYFKRYNDYYGHIEGDKVIQELGAILRNYHNGEDMIAARYGGEEFFLIVKGKPADEAKIIAENILQQLRDKKIVHGESRVYEYVTASIGVAYYNLITEADVINLIREADNALYLAKERGRNQCVIESYTIE